MASYDGGHALFVVDRSGTDAEGRTLRSVELRVHAVDPESGTVAFAGQSTLATLATDETINSLAYATLATDVVAAAIQTNTGRVLLATCADGVASAQDAAEPFDGRGNLSFDNPFVINEETRGDQGDVFMAQLDDGRLAFTYTSTDFGLGDPSGSSVVTRFLTLDEIPGLLTIGTDGNDLISGGLGSDTLSGGLGDDTITGVMGPTP